MELSNNPPPEPDKSESNPLARTRQTGSTKNSIPDEYARNHSSLESSSFSGQYREGLSDKKRDYITPALNPILDSKWTAYTAYPVTIIGSAAWILGQTNQQILDKIIPYIPYTTDSWGNFIYPVITQFALKIGLKIASKRDKLNPFLQSKHTNKILLASPEITAIASAGLMTTLELFKVFSFITPSLDDIPATIIGGIAGYLSIGRKNKRFLLRKKLNPDISYLESFKQDIEDKFYLGPVLTCLDIYERIKRKLEINF